LPGNYSLESELLVENVHSFSTYAWPGSSSKVVITCGHNARFEFRNVSTVTVSGLAFVGCFKNHVRHISHFQFENSGFFGNGREIVNGTVLDIEESMASLDRVVFMTLSAVDEHYYRYTGNCTVLQEIFSTVAVDRVTGIALRSSNVTITQSQFEGNNVGLNGAVISNEFGSDIVITNSTFTNNSARGLNVLCVFYSHNDKNITSGIVRTIGHGNSVKIYDSKFMQNEGVILLGENFNMLITHTRFMNNKCSIGCVATVIFITDSNLTVSYSTFSDNIGSILTANSTDSEIVSISYSEFFCNNGSLRILDGVLTSIDHSKFINNTDHRSILRVSSTEVTISHSDFFCNIGGLSYDTLSFVDGVITTIDHCKFINNTGYSILGVANTDMILHLNEFINNNIPTGRGVVYMRFYTTAENLTGNEFTNNSAAYDILISSRCGSDRGISLGNSPCTPCSSDWYLDLVGIVVGAFIAGIALVIFMLALNLTVAVGTLNGILFYANIVAANTETYFLPFTAPNFVTVFISWLNLDIGFDVCYIRPENFNSVVDVHELHKALLQLAFPVFVIFLVIIVIVVSERSSKFAKIIGKGNPVAVLATMILLSSAKFFNIIIVTFSLTYYQPAYGSRNVDFRAITDSFESLKNEGNNRKLEVATYSVLAIDVSILFLGVIFAALVFSWQWLLRYQDKAIFKLVRYQKLRHFIEPYHAPYTAQYRYWTGLLLFVRILLYLVSVLNFSLDPRVDLLATIFIVGGLILLKGVTAKRVYKNWPIDVMETAIYFNLVAFSALTWYNLDFGGNQVAVAYTSVMIIFILLLGVIVFHVLRYTRLYKCFFVKRHSSGHLLSYWRRSQRNSYYSMPRKSWMDFGWKDLWLEMKTCQP
jgi:hypothetical protein